MEEKKNTMENMTKERAKEIVAKKYGLGTTLVTGHKASYWEEAMDLVLASGSVAAPKEEEESLHDQLNTEQHLVRVYKKQLECVRQQLKEREEALKELLPIAEQYRTKIDNPNWEDDFNKSKAIIEKARKLISK